MPRAEDDPTLSVPNMRAEFRTVNPDVFAKAQDLDTTRRLGAIEMRAEAIKQRFYDHFERNQDAWVAAEAIRLAATRKFPTLQHPAPKVFGAERPRGLDFAELMATKAAQNVHARAIRRLTSINSIKANLQNALIRNQPRLAQVHQPPANDTIRKQGLKNSNV